MNVMTRRLSLPSGGDRKGVVWFAGAAAYVVIMALSASVLSWDIWAALVIGPILFTLTIPIVRRGLRNDPDPRMARLVMVALLAKMVGACARYALTFQVYEGRADAEGYHGSGARLAKAFWEGNLAEQMRWDAPELTGTPFINIVTGLRGGANLENMWGQFPGEAEFGTNSWFDNDPVWGATRFVEQRDNGTLPDMWITTGNGLPGPHENLGNERLQESSAALANQAIVGGVIEAATQYCTANLARRFGELGIPAHFDFAPAGTHSWGYWEDDLKQSWPMMANAMGARWGEI